MTIAQLELIKSLLKCRMCSSLGKNIEFWSKILQSTIIVIIFTAYAFSRTGRASCNCCSSMTKPSRCRLKSLICSLSESSKNLRRFNSSLRTLGLLHFSLLKQEALLVDTILCESKLLFDAVDDVSLSAISPSDGGDLGLQMGAGVQILTDEAYFVSVFVSEGLEGEVSTGVVLKMDVVEVVRLFLQNKL